MNYNIEDIDKITRFKTWGSDKKVNALLEAHMNEKDLTKIIK